VLLWLAVAFVAYVLIIRSPATHVYVIILPWMAVAGLAAAMLWDWISHRGFKVLALAARLRLFCSLAAIYTPPICARTSNSGKTGRPAGRPFSGAGSL